MMRARRKAGVITLRRILVLTFTLLALVVNDGVEAKQKRKRRKAVEVVEDDEFAEDSTGSDTIGEYRRESTSSQEYAPDNLPEEESDVSAPVSAASEKTETSYVVEIGMMSLALVYVVNYFYGKN